MEVRRLELEGWCGHVRWWGGILGVLSFASGWKVGGRRVDARCIFGERDGWMDVCLRTNGCACFGSGLVFYCLMIVKDLGTHEPGG